MRVHFIHIAKTGGTAIKDAIRSGGTRRTTFGRLVLHKHRFRLRDVPDGEHAFFVMRDPATRFLSSFYSRLRKGEPRHVVEWKPGEQAAFERFPTPQALLDALGSSDRSTRRAAEQAMFAIQHLRRDVGYWLGSPRAFRNQIPKIVFIARQETLGDEWGQLKDVLGLPSDLDLPQDATAAHRASGSEDRALDEHAVRTLKDWYAKDYRLIELCEELRGERGWATARSSAH